VKRLSICRARESCPRIFFFGENITKLKAYELYEWWYQREFATPAGTAARKLELHFRGVDCLATYWLNGKVIGESQDSMIDYSFDVTGKLNANAPTLLPSGCGRPSSKPPARNMTGVHRQSFGYESGGQLDSAASAQLRFGTSCARGDVLACGAPLNSLCTPPQESPTCILRRIEVEGNRAS